MTTNAQIINRYAEQAGTDNPRYLRNRSTPVYAEGDTLYSYGSHFPLARIMPGENGKRSWWLLNGDIYSVSTSRHQSETRAAVNATGLPVLIVPFTALNQARIDLTTIKPVDISPDRYEHTCHEADDISEVPDGERWEAQRNHDHYSGERCWGGHGIVTAGKYHWDTSRHWLGASVFTAAYTDESRTVRGKRFKVYVHPGGRERLYPPYHEADGEWVEDTTTVRYHYEKIHPQVTAHFLSAFDENERTPLYFLSQLPEWSAPATVAEAFEALKPEEVKAAEDHGLATLRQGDVFAIPAGLTARELREMFGAVNVPAATPQYRQSWGGLESRTFGKTEAYVLDVNHTATEVLVTGGRTYARGMLRHKPQEWGRRPEHRQVKLGDGKTWYRLVKNTVPVVHATSRSWSLGGRVD